MIFPVPHSIRRLLPILSFWVLSPAVVLLAGDSEKESSEAMIGSLAVVELLEFHQRELQQEFLPQWQEGRVDLQYGGFLPDYDPTDRRARYRKNTYDQGRGLWLFSYLYNHFGNRPEHREAADKAWAFISENMLREDDMFYEETDRRGKVIHEVPNIYGDIYIFMGLSEYYKLTGDSKLRDQAVRTAITVFERASSPDYLHAYQNHGRARARDGHPDERGLQRLGTWQHFLGGLTATLRNISDPRLEEIAAYALEKVTRFHYDPVERVAWENLPFGGTPPDEFRYTGNVSTFHIIQAAWMTMDEGLRRNDPQIFKDGLDIGRAYKDLVFERSQNQIGGYTDELLIFLLLAYEHTADPEIAHWFEKTWQLGLENPDWNRIDMLHHPRRLFYAIDILERIIDRKGKPSRFLGLPRVEKQP
jgi:hypothetical protein